VRAHDAKRDLALCVASDGLWDFVEEKDGAEFTQSIGDFLSEISGSFAVKSPKKHWGVEAETLWGKCMKMPLCWATRVVILMFRRRLGRLSWSAATRPL